MDEFLITSAFLIGFILVILTVPKILLVAKSKNLFEPFNHRKIHTQIVPPLGGVAIFIGFTIGSILSSDGYDFENLKFIIAAVILMFFLGLKDDLVTTSPKSKLLVQVIAASILILSGGIKFTSLHGYLGIYQFNNEIISYFLTLFVFIVIINAFNLIDGIDGLASGLGIMGASTFGAWFYLNGEYSLAAMAFALVGSLSAFSLYNVFGHKNKLFMGDTGSLVLGTIMSVLVVLFNEPFNGITPAYSLKAAPSVAFAVIMIPLIDTIRVMIIRINQKKSPFSADQNHIHHRMLKLIPKHIYVTLTIVAANSFIVLLAFVMCLLNVEIHLHLFIIFTLGILFSFIPDFILLSRKKKDLAKINLLHSST